EGRDDERGDPRAGAPGVDLRRRYVVPGAAVLVIGDEDGGAGPERALLDRLQNRRHLVVATADVGVARVLVLRADRLPEDDRRQIAGRDAGEQLLFVLQVLLAGLGAIAKLLEIGEGLVVELEEIVRLAGDGVVPAAGIPDPADALFAQAVADGDAVLRRQQLLRVGDLGGMRLIAGLDRVHGVTIGCDGAVFDEHATTVELRHHVLG